MSRPTSAQLVLNQKKNSHGTKPKKNIVKINVYATRKTRARKSKLRRLIKKVLAAEEKSFTTVSVILTDDAYLKRLSEQYFNKKRSTNVISFDLGKEVEIYVSENKARDAYDLYYFVLHGLLHAIGYDHRKKKDDLLMQKKCSDYIDYA